MIWIYRLFFLPVFVLSIPYILWLMKRRGGYERDYDQKFGNLPETLVKHPNKKRIWIQAVSVGEVRALRSLLQHLAQDPRVEIILTTTTNTGYWIAKENYRDLVREVFYFPIDCFIFSRKSWDRIQPDLCMLMEGELWPEHIYQAKQRQVPIILINARISDKSYRKYRRLGRPAQRLFRAMSLIIASSKENAVRFEGLGCDSEKVIPVGNLKCDVPIPAILTTGEKHQLAAELGLPTVRTEGRQPVILCGASTWQGEEFTLFQICQVLRDEGIDLHLIITPRHMERREEIRTQVKNFNLSHHFRSEGSAAGTVDISIADTTGELTKFLQLADIVFVGKSLPPYREGQTPIEAGILKKPVLFGPGMSNFRDIIRSLLRFGVAQQVENAAELESSIRSLCVDPDLRAARGAKAESWLKANQGATKRTLAELDRFLQ